MSLDKFNTTPSPLQVVERVNDVIDALDAGSFDGYWTAGETVEVGDIRFVEGRDNVGYVLECVQAGTTGDSAPEISEEDIEPNTPEISNINELEGVLGVVKGGTGATTAEGARENLEVSVKTYTTYQQIGLNSAPSTLLELVQAVPTHSIFMREVSTSYETLGLPYMGLLIISKGNYGNVSMWNYRQGGPTIVHHKVAFCNWSEGQTEFKWGEIPCLENGVLQIENGGTGATTVEAARENLGITSEALGLGSVASEDVVPIEKGGTGATTAAQACDNLGALKVDEVSNAANKVPRYSSSGHLVLPDGSEFWIE